MAEMTLTNIPSLLTSGQLGMNAIWVILAVSALVFLFSALMLIRGQRRYAKSLAQIHELQRNVRAITAAAIGVGERVLEIERRQRRVAEWQEQLDIYDTGSQSYDQAINMAKNGAETKDLVETCGISESEAELISLMHRLDQTA